MKKRHFMVEFEQNWIRYVHVRVQYHNKNILSSTVWEQNCIFNCTYTLISRFPSSTALCCFFSVSIRDFRDRSSRSTVSRTLPYSGPSRRSDAGHVDVQYRRRSWVCCVLDLLSISACTNYSLSARFCRSRTRILGHGDHFLNRWNGVVEPSQRSSCNLSSVDDRTQGSRHAVQTSFLGVLCRRPFVN